MERVAKIIIPNDHVELAAMRGKKILFTLSLLCIPILLTTLFQSYSLLKDSSIEDFTQAKATDYLLGITFFSLIAFLNWLPIWGIKNQLKQIRLAKKSLTKNLEFNKIGISFNILHAVGLMNSFMIKKEIPDMFINWKEISKAEFTEGYRSGKHYITPYLKLYFNRNHLRSTKPELDDYINGNEELFLSRTALKGKELQIHNLIKSMGHIEIIIEDELK